MTKIERIKAAFKENNNVMNASELTLHKIYYWDIQKLLQEGRIEQLRRGCYHWVGKSSRNEAAIINNLFPDAILCMDTALFYYGYSDENPAEWHFAIEKNVSKVRVKMDYPSVQIYRTELHLMLIGETVGRIEEVNVRIYDRDRTACDVLRNIKSMEKEAFGKAIQNYERDPKKNIPNLMQYAKTLGIEKKVKSLINVSL